MSDTTAITTIGVTMGAEPAIKPRRAYPRKVEIVRAIEAAKACGLDVAGYDVRPDGTIRVFDVRTAPKTDFDRWEDQL